MFCMHVGHPESVWPIHLLTMCMRADLCTREWQPPLQLPRMAYMSRYGRGLGTWGRDTGDSCRSYARGSTALQAAIMRARAGSARAACGDTRRPGLPKVRPRRAPGAVCGRRQGGRASPHVVDQRPEELPHVCGGLKGAPHVDENFEKALPTPAQNGPGTLGTRTRRMTIESGARSARTSPGEGLPARSAIGWTPRLLLV